MSKYKQFMLITWALLLVFANVTVLRGTEKTLSRDYHLKEEAALLMKAASTAIKEHKQALGIDLNEDDIFATGLLGERYTGITTTLGSLPSKRTSTNPNFAAVMVELLTKAGVKKGDYVGITFSGSFPALNIAVSAAAEVMELDVLVMASVGSSSYGANNPDLTYIDMADYLFEQGYFSFTADYVSLGGASDIGEDMFEELRTDITKRMIEKKKHFIYEPDFQKNINLRKNIFLKHSSEMKAFINVGGNLVAMGQEEAAFPNKNGLITQRNIIHSNNIGLMDTFLNRNIPVIQILDIKRLAFKFDLAYDPVKEPIIGEGSAYLETEYNLLVPIISVIVSAGILIFINFFNKYLD